MENKSYTKCPICETKVEIDNFLETYISPYNNQEYKLYECPNCELQWWEPLKIIPEFYGKEILESYLLRHKGLNRELQQNHKAFFNFFSKNIKGKLLDIGCGDGLFLKEAKKHGFEVWGIDFDRKSVEIAKRNLGVKTIYPMSLEEFYDYAKERNLKFDVITFFEVLEHQDNPRKFLEIVRDLLREGGYIAGSVPNRERLFAEIHWKYFNTDFPPHHFLRFSKASLENVLKIRDFTNIQIYTLIFPKNELFANIEKKFFGNAFDKFKSMLKVKSYNIEYVDKLNLDILEKINYKKSIRFQILKILKNVRAILLLPFALVYYPKLKKGVYLYFQAKYEEKNSNNTSNTSRCGM